VAIVRAATGSLDPALLDGVRDGFGLMLIDGLIAYETGVGARISAELLGAGDLIQGDGEIVDAILARHDSWRILWPCRLAPLDAAFAERVRPWPQIAEALVRRASRRAADLDTIRAISGHPRLELRLDLVFWHLAGRWGRVEPNGIHLALPLTHRLLGELIGAERPSISHALARLGRAQLITGAAGDWHLVGSLSDHMQALSGRAGGDDPLEPNASFRRRPT
jgi:CRP/FNR family transcriptional regulator, cyclic AMP receptor protein